MAINEHDVLYSQFSRTDGRLNSNLNDNDSDVPLSDLLRRFGTDAAALVKQEIALARLELRESAKGYAKEISSLVIAGVVGWFGAMTLVAFLVIGLGALIHNYWLSALVVGVVLAVVAGIMAKGALARMKHNSLAPEETMDTLQQDQRWAKHEAQDFKRKLTA